MTFLSRHKFWLLFTVIAILTGPLVPIHGFIWGFMLGFIGVSIDAEANKETE